jgi:hypothetical protein
MPKSKKGDTRDEIDGRRRRQSGVVEKREPQAGRSSLTTTLSIHAK